MRIVHLITRLIVGGAQENTILSCEGLHAAGHEVFLLSGPTEGPEGSLLDRATSGGYAYELVHSLVRPVDPIRDLKALLALRKRFQELRPDVVHTHSSKAGVLGRLAAAAAKVPSIVHTIHGMSFNRTQPAAVRMTYALAERYCAGKCHALVTVADEMRRQALAAGIGRPQQFVTIRSGIELETFNPAVYDASALRAQGGIDDGEVVIGTVARLFANKGYEQLIEIMDIALRCERRLRFVWIGDGTGRAAYEDELVRRGLRDRVRMAGLVPPAEMPRYLSAIDVLAHTSQWEGLPRAVVQALLMEKPVVCFALDGAPEVVRPGQTGILVERGDLSAFAAALVALARDPDRRRQYGKQGRRDCLRTFDNRAMVEHLDALYRRLAEGRPPTG